MSAAAIKPADRNESPGQAVNRGKGENFSDFKHDLPQPIKFINPVQVLNWPLYIKRTIEGAHQFIHSFGIYSKMASVRIFSPVRRLGPPQAGNTHQQRPEIFEHLISRAKESRFNSLSSAFWYSECYQPEPIDARLRRSLCARFHPSIIF